TFDEERARLWIATRGYLFTGPIDAGGIDGFGDDSIARFDAQRRWMGERVGRVELVRHERVHLRLAAQRNRCHCGEKDRHSSTSHHPLRNRNQNEPKRLTETRTPLAPCLLQLGSRNVATGAPGVDLTLPKNSADRAQEISSGYFPAAQDTDDSSKSLAPSS